jgi:hypothetical protein
MNIKSLPLFLAVAILVTFSGQALGRHVTHRVTPKNIDEQPFSFKVQIKDVEQLKEVEIVVKQKAGKPDPVVSATGSVVVGERGNKKAASPAITRVQSDGVQTYTFRVSPADLDRTYFTFTETPQDARTPFPFPGDYWVFDLSDFVGSPKN